MRDDCLNYEIELMINNKLFDNKKISNKLYEIVKDKLLKLCSLKKED